ncbi:MAG: sulfatase-like hydrolase/transferase, partial [Bacteriovoracia bacterium]
LKEVDRASELGIYDEHLFAYLKRELETATSPQFFFVLTTTSQPPFDLPLSHKSQGLNRLSPSEKKSFGRDSDDVLALAKSLQYSLGHLAGFIDGVKSGPLKDNLALAVTGDHAYWVGRNRGDENLVQRLGVPFYLYLPSDLKPETWNKENWGSHVDILPTLFEATLPGKAYWGFGQSLFKPRGAGLNAQNVVVSDVGAWIGERAKCWTSETEKTLVDCVATDELKALLQFNRAQMGLADEFLRTQASGQIGLLP